MFFYPILVSTLFFYNMNRVGVSELFVLVVDIFPDNFYMVAWRNIKPLIINIFYKIFGIMRAALVVTLFPSANNSL